MNVKESLLNHRPTEYGGPTAQRGFTYQNDWAIKRLIDLHEGNDNYALIIEYQDDVQIINDIENPTSIEIFQLKTTGKPSFKLGNLILGKEDQKSILTKLYHNVIRHKDSLSKAAIVSNSRFECKLKDSAISSSNLRQIGISELAARDLDKVCNKVNLQSKIDDFRNYIDSIYLIVSDMPLNHTEQYIIDRLVKYFEKNGTYSLPNRVSPFFATLRSQIQRKTNYHFEVNSYEELIKHKSISRDEMNEILQVGAQKSDSDRMILEALCNRISSEGTSLKLERNIRRNVKQYLIDKSSSKRRILESLEFDIEAVISRIIDNDFSGSLIELSKEVYNKIDQKYGFSSDYITSLAMYKFIKDE